MLVNDKGVKITGEKKLSKRKYAKADGTPDWEKYLINSDEYGFYKLAVYDDGNYTKRVLLPVGKRLIRYGSPLGHFMTDKGIPYIKLSLPYIEDTVEYHIYEVVRPISVVEGKVAPGFDTPDEPEKAVQYFTEKSVSRILGLYIKEVPFDGQN